MRLNARQNLSRPQRLIVGVMFLVLVRTCSCRSSHLRSPCTNEQTKHELVCHLLFDGLWVGLLLNVNCLVRPTSFTRMNNTEYSIHHLASSYIPSPREIAPLSSRKTSASVSLSDSEWRNLKVSIVLESILSFKGQFASSKSSINRDTFEQHTQISSDDIDVRKCAFFTYNEGINEVFSADN